MQIVLVHGWGFTPAMWDPVQIGLKRKALTPDLGFFGPANTSLPSAEPVLAVGHSLGLLWLLTKACLPKDSILLGINGFTRFSRAEDFPAGVLPRVLDRMMTGLGRDTASVLHQFRKNCGMREMSCVSDETLDVPRLMEGLDLLKHGDARTQAPRVQAVLASRDDAIVTQSMTEACFPPNHINWLETGGHLLPLTHPDRCATFILEAYEEHSADGR